MSNWEWIAQDQAVFDGPRLILGFGIVATAGGAATASLYDGRDASGKLLATISAPASETRFVSLPEPFAVGSGLYVDVGANVTGVMVLWSIKG